MFVLVDVYGIVALVLVIIVDVVEEGVVVMVVVHVQLRQRRIFHIILLFVTCIRGFF